MMIYAKLFQLIMITPLF